MGLPGCTIIAPALEGRSLGVQVTRTCCLNRKQIELQYRCCATKVRMLIAQHVLHYVGPSFFNPGNIREKARADARFVQQAGFL